MNALVLFDIDATLLRTSGAGMRAMMDAGRELFGDGFGAQHVSFAGRLDPLILTDLFAGAGIAETPANVAAFRKNYAKHLAIRQQGAHHHQQMPGALELVHRVRSLADTATGLLTGNYQETAAIKLRASGFEPEWFGVCAWGDDSSITPPKREHLPPVAMRRHAERFGVNVEPSAVTIIGDTPHDVRCARVNGCRCLAVATGDFSLEQLREAGADWVVPDLSRTEEVMSWLTNR